MCDILFILYTVLTKIITKYRYDTTKWSESHTIKKTPGEYNDMNQNSQGNPIVKKNIWTLPIERFDSNSYTFSYICIRVISPSMGKMLYGSTKAMMGMPKHSKIKT